VAGAIGATVNNNGNQGALYVFVEPPNGWVSATENAILTATDGAANSELGASVTTNGSTVVGGAPCATVNGNVCQGAAYVFVGPPNGWSSMNETGKLTAADGNAYAAFGGSSVIAGNTIVIGAGGTNIGSDRNHGAAYVFIKPRTGWRSTAKPKAKLTASDGAQDDFLGQSVSISGKTIVAGAPNASLQQGAEYVFRKPLTGGWANKTEDAKLVSSNGAAGDLQGWSSAVSNGTVFVGAPQTDTGPGRALVFGP
jgi:hypothetical protein